MAEKFSDVIIVDLVKKAVEDMERTITLVPSLSQRANVYHGVAAMLLDWAAAIRASNDGTDKKTAALGFIRLLQKQLVGG